MKKRWKASLRGTEMDSLYKTRQKWMEYEGVE